VIAVVLLAAVSVNTNAQDADRERAQMLQLQQQLRKLQSDNAAMQQERSQLQDKAKDADRLKTEATASTKEVVRLRAQLAAHERDLAAAQARSEEMRGQMDTQIAQWKKAIDDRDTALQFAAAEKRKVDAAVNLLAARLKVQTERGDFCETRHGQALELGNDLIDRLEKSGLRLCEPFTAIWRVRKENEIQDLRQRLYELRLDVPRPLAAATEALAPVAPAVPTVAPAVPDLPPAGGSVAVRAAGSGAAPAQAPPSAPPVR
jgi:chromosome segregation ATPase